MIESAESLHHALQVESQGLSPDQIRARLATRGDPLRTLAALFRAHRRAADLAHRRGITGYRRCTYAESRLITMQRRLGLVK